MNIEDVFELPKREPVSLYGLELEIEAVDFGQLPKEWASKADGSLRNGGVEFVSQPIELSKINSSLTALFSVLDLSEDSYSDRTSIHVHCNMHGLSYEQVKSMCLLYLVFEEMLFNFVDASRRKNIFCVALSECNSAERLFKSFYVPDFRNGIHWEKYTAFNLLPLSQFGTVEFRHMHGNSDVNYITSWVKIIDCLKQKALQQPFENWFDEVKTLNSSSEYYSFARNVFREVQDVFFHGLVYSDFKKMMYKNIVIAKMWEFLTQEQKKKEVEATKRSKKKASLNTEEINLMQQFGFLTQDIEVIRRNALPIPPAPRVRTQVIDHDFLAQPEPGPIF